jgi:hypothetical protein
MSVGGRGRGEETMIGIAGAEFVDASLRLSSIFDKLIKIILTTGRPERSRLVTRLGFNRFFFFGFT